MSPIKKAYLSFLIFSFASFTIWGTIAFTPNFYLLPGLIAVSIIGFDSDPTMKNVMAEELARRLTVKRTIAQEAILPVSLLFAWPMWLVLSIVVLWRD